MSLADYKQELDSINDQIYKLNERSMNIVSGAVSRETRIMFQDLEYFRKKRIKVMKEAKAKYPWLFEKK